MGLVSWNSHIISVYPLGVVTSDGRNKTSPHCSWWNKCEFTSATKQECATALCKAQGFSDGAFISASNNFCQTSLTSDSIYVYALKMSTNNSGNIVLFNTNKEASITADCHSGTNFVNKNL